MTHKVTFSIIHNWWLLQRSYCIITAIVNTHYNHHHNYYSVMISYYKWQLDGLSKIMISGV